MSDALLIIFILAIMYHMWSCSCEISNFETRQQYDLKKITYEMDDLSPSVNRQLPKLPPIYLEGFQDSEGGKITMSHDDEEPLNDRFSALVTKYSDDDLIHLMYTRTYQSPEQEESDIMDIYMLRDMETENFENGLDMNSKIITKLQNNNKLAKQNTLNSRAHINAIKEDMELDYERFEESEPWWGN
jgi:hypothetical protein